MGLRCPVLWTPFVPSWLCATTSVHQPSRFLSAPGYIPLVPFSLLRRFSSSTGVARRLIVCKPSRTSFPQSSTRSLSRLDPPSRRTRKLREYSLSFSFKPIFPLPCRPKGIPYRDFRDGYRGAYFSNIERRYRYPILPRRPAQFPRRRDCQCRVVAAIIRRLRGDEIITWTVYNYGTPLSALSGEAAPVTGRNAGDCYLRSSFIELSGKLK